jgi:hypothetical protein
MCALETSLPQSAGERPNVFLFRDFPADAATYFARLGQEARLIKAVLLDMHGVLIDATTRPSSVLDSLAWPSRRLIQTAGETLED